MSSVPAPVEIAAWLQHLGTEFVSLNKTQIRELKPNDRIVVGRTHAALFANYRVDERANLAAGTRFAATFARMARSKVFGDLTCREFALYGARFLARRNGKPFHSPFDVEAEFEYGLE